MIATNSNGYSEMEYQAQDVEQAAAMARVWLVNIEAPLGVMFEVDDDDACRIVRVVAGSRKKAKE